MTACRWLNIEETVDSDKLVERALEQFSGRSRLLNAGIACQKTALCEQVSQSGSICSFSETGDCLRMRRCGTWPTRYREDLEDSSRGGYFHPFPETRESIRCYEHIPVVNFRLLILIRKSRFVAGLILTETMEAASLLISVIAMDSRKSFSERIRMSKSCNLQENSGLKR